MLRSKKIIFLLFFFSSNTLFTQDLDSLELVRQLNTLEIKDDASVDTYETLLFDNIGKLSPQQQYDYLTKTVDIAKEFNRDTLFVYAQLHRIDLLNNYNLDLGTGKTENHREVSKTLAQSIEPAVLQLNSNFHLGHYYNLVGIPYQVERDYVKAIENYIKSIDYFKQSSDPAAAFYLIENIINLYQNEGDHKKAKEYAQELITLSKYEKDNNQILLINALGYYHLSKSYNKLGIKDSTFYFANKAIENIQQLDNIEAPNDLYTVCDIYFYQLDLLVEKENNSAATALLEKVKSICNSSIVSEFPIDLADYYLKVKNYEQVEKILKNISVTNFAITDYHKLLKIQGRYQEAIGNYQEAFAIQKELLKIEREKAQKSKKDYVAFADARLAASKQEEAINSLKLKGEAEILKSRLFLLGLIMSLLLLGLSLFAYRRLQANKKIIEQQAEELKKTDALKSKLFTNISHELRTPLTMIAGPIDYILQQYELKESDKQQLLLAKKSSQQLLNTSNHIMELTKSEIGQSKLETAQFYWNDLLKHLLPSYDRIAQNKGLSLMETKNFTSKILLQTDPLKLKTILSNLLQNAIKYNQEGGEILLDTKDLGDQIAFLVKDTGIGIERSELPLVFNRYYQSKNRVEAEGGFGIGLAICQEYVKLLGGTIDIESKLGLGTTISVKLPKIIGKPNSASFYKFDTKSLTNSPIFSPIKESKGQENLATHLLIVEDNKDVCQFLQTALNRDYTLTFATNGREALKKLEVIAPDLIITDWMMPIMNGLTFTQKIKEHPQFNHLPILMLTARSLPVDQLKAFQKGVDDYLLKPFDVNNLKLRIEHLLDFAQGRKEIISTNTNTHQATLLAENTLSDVRPKQKLKNQKDLEWIGQVEEVIQKHISDVNLKLEIISAEIKMSTDHLNRKIKVITGLTFMKFIDEVRFWEARRLLEEKEALSVKALAYSVGFKSVKNFSRNFKKRFGFYPSEYL